MNQVVAEKQSKQNPYPYVYVDDDGSYCELSDEDKKYLEEKFHPADGARPYVKHRYSSLTPDGKIGGFCKRSKLPKGLNPGEIPKPKKWWQFW